MGFDALMVETRCTSVVRTLGVQYLETLFQTLTAHDSPVTTILEKVLGLFLVPGRLPVRSGSSWLAGSRWFIFGSTHSKTHIIAAMETVAIPLTDALHWSPSTPRTILIGDSIHSDGSFVLHSLASQVLSKGGEAEGRIFWLSGGPWTETLVATALKRFGCEAAATYLRKRQQQKQQHQAYPERNVVTEEDENVENLCILSVTRMLSSAFQNEVDEKDETDNEISSWDGPEVFLKQIYHRIHKWSRQNPKQQSQSPSWIILDDLSAIANVLGQRVVYRFVHTLRALAVRESLGLVLKCSWDGVLSPSPMMEASAPAPMASGVNALHDVNHHQNSFGAGSSSHATARGAAIAWEPCLVEFADDMIQVVPLPSGFSRHAHGRLIYSARRQDYLLRDGELSKKLVSLRKTKNAAIQSSPNTYSSSPPSIVVLNYLLTDTNVTAIRIRS